jgi:non-homologous end joining protein Ku
MRKIMARSFWRGAISFGLVSIPVKMYVGTESNPLVFHLLHKKCLTRPHEILRCDKDSEDITIKDTVRGYEYAKGQYVVIDEKDFARIPIKTIRTIDNTDFPDYVKGLCKSVVSTIWSRCNGGFRMFFQSRSAIRRLRECLF